jgi:hypothetical protein
MWCCHSCVKNLVLWDVTSCSLVGRCNRFSGSESLNIQGSGVLYPDKRGISSTRNAGIYLHNCAAVHARTRNHEAMLVWMDASSVFDRTGLKGPWPASRHMFILICCLPSHKSFSVRSSHSACVLPPFFPALAYCKHFAAKDRSIPVTGPGVP